MGDAKSHLPFVHLRQMGESMRRFLICGIAVLTLGLGPARAAETIDPDLLAGLQPRLIGPAGMSGRVPAIAAVESNPNVV
jgi:hypothetical protein